MATYRAQYVRCGKRNCRSCPHGPYWYKFWKEGGKTRSAYCGKVDPRERPAGAASRADRRDDIFNPRSASLQLAWELLGVRENANYEECKAAYRRLVRENHPDRGGETVVMQRLEAAWSYLKARHGWRG